MRWTALVVLLLAGCGGDDAGDQAPDCDIPPKVCADGSEPVAPVVGQDVGSTVGCKDAEGSFVRQWLQSDGDEVSYVDEAGNITGCWSEGGTVAILQVRDGASSDETCWARDGSPGDCADVRVDWNAAWTAP